MFCIAHSCQDLQRNPRRSFQNIKLKGLFKKLYIVTCPKFGHPALSMKFYVEVRT